MLRPYPFKFGDERQGSIFVPGGNKLSVTGFTYLLLYLANTISRTSITNIFCRPLCITSTFITMWKSIISRQALITFSSSNICLTQALPIIRITLQRAFIRPINMAPTKLTSNQRIIAISIWNTLITLFSFNISWAIALS
jgi:hypothetical protein